MGAKICKACLKDNTTKKRKEKNYSPSKNRKAFEENEIDIFSKQNIKDEKTVKTSIKNNNNTIDYFEEDSIKIRKSDYNEKKHERKKMRHSENNYIHQMKEKDKNNFKNQYKGEQIGKEFYELKIDILEIHHLKKNGEIDKIKNICYKTEEESWYDKIYKEKIQSMSYLEKADKKEEFEFAP